jgi:muramoyltetrapeptide carboxypeptidase
MRLLSRLDLSVLQQHPRAYIGFSDHTAVHLALYRRGVVSFHAPHAGAETTRMTDRCFHEVLWNDAPAGALELPDGVSPFVLAEGTGEGPLVGGNLSLLAAMAGTPASLDARGAILFIEEIGESAYRIDRLWTQLALSGALDGVRGLAFGQFTDCGDDVDSLLAGFARDLGVPTLAGLPFGHERDNWTLPIGVRARLDSRSASIEILEPAVS